MGALNDEHPLGFMLKAKIKKSIELIAVFDLGIGHKLFEPLLILFLANDQDIARFSDDAIMNALYHH